MKKCDFLLIAGLLALCGIIFIFFNINKENGSVVNISIDGAEYMLLPLNEDTTLRIPETGADYNIITIKDGKASVTEADCPDSICVKHSAIHLNGETIICLPHKLSISISDNETTTIDGITY